MALLASPGAPSGRRRFWVTVVCFALANLAAWVAYHRAFGPHRKGLLRVESFAPGDGATVGLRPAMMWRFNLPVVPQPAGSDPPVRITPAMTGKWQWRNDRTLSFLPETELPKATKFTLSIPPDSLYTADGFRLAKPFVATVKTQPLKLLGVRQAGFENQNRFVLAIEFNDRVLPADAAAKLSITGPAGETVDFNLHGDAVGNVVRVLTEPVSLAGIRGAEPAQLTVSIRAGLAGVSGPLGLEDAVEQKVAVGSTLAVTGAEPRCPANGQPSIVLRVNGEDHDLESARQVISVHPPVQFTMQSEYSCWTLCGNFQSGTRYTVKVGQPPKGADPAKYPRPDVLSVYLPDRDKGVWFDHEEGYLGSRGNRTVLAHAVNVTTLKVAVWRVYDNNLVAWRNAAGRYRWRSSTEAFSHPIATRTFPLPREKNKVHDVPVALDDLLPADAARDGVYRLSLAEVPDHAQPSAADNDADDDYGADAHASAVVTLSDIGLSAQQSVRGINVWAVSLSTAKPLAHVRVRVFSTKNQLLGEAVTNADGLAFITGMQPADGEKPRVLLAETLPAEITAAPSTQPTTQPIAMENLAAPKSGLTWLDLRDNEWNLADIDTSGRPYLRAGYQAFVYTDRGVYRPGETVHLRTIVRDAKSSVPPPFPVRWQIRRPDLRNWRSQVAILDADGSASLTLQLPPDLVTGQWTAHVAMPGLDSAGRESFGNVAFQVEEYLPNRLKVNLSLNAAGSAEPETRRFAIGKTPLNAAVQADYLFGRPAAGLPAGLSVRIDPTRFAPAGWNQWTFGDAARLIAMPGTSPIGAVPVKRRTPPNDSRQGVLDQNGHGQWELDLRKILALDQPPSTQPALATEYRGPWCMSLAASVQETGGRAVTASEYIDVDALPWYIGLRAKETPKPNAPATFEVNLVTPQGRIAAVDARLDLSLFHETWNNSLVHRQGKYYYESHRVLDAVEKAGQPFVTTAAGRALVNVTVPASGAYVLRMRDAATGAMSSLRFYASDGQPWDDNITREKPERLELVMLPIQQSTPAPATMPANPDPKSQFRVGDRAMVLVRSPFAGQLLLTVQTDEVLETHVLDMPASQVTVPIQITQACRPNAYVTASVVRPINPDAKWQVHRAYGVAKLLVDPSDRRLNVEIVAPTEMRPLSTLDVKLRVLDPHGAPVPNAAITIAAVDEGILQLTRFATPDPLGFFYSPRALGVKSSDLYARLMPEVPRPLAASQVGGDGDGGSSRYRTPIAAQRVRPVALCSEVVHTDAAGEATTHLAVPEFAGKLRVMAVAYLASAFGSVDTPVLVRSPLLVQSSFPRFAAPGDRFTVPIVVFNNAATPADVTVTAELIDADNPLAFANTEKRLIMLPPRLIKAAGQESLRIDFAATLAAGVARVRLVASMNGHHCQETIELPIRPASPTITRGEYAAVGPDSPLKLNIPGSLLDGTERLDIRLTPWPTLQLPDGLDYLERYPYGCAEQTISTAFPLVFLSDLGPLIAPGAFTRQRVIDKVQAGIVRLIGMQTADGGLSMWPGSSQSWPWATAYAAHFITEAEAAGHVVPDDFRIHLLAYLRHFLDKPGDDGDLLECQAYGCYVLAIAGKPEPAIMSRLTELASANGTSAIPEFAAQRTQARFYLSMAWLAAGRRDLATKLIPIDPPLPRQHRQTSGNIGSTVRDLATMVNAMLMVQPDHPALPILVQQLADTGKKQQWRSTQDCAFAVMALGRYLRQCKAQQPYDAAELLLSGNPLAATDAGKSLAWSIATATTRPTTAPTGREFSVRITGPSAARGHLTWIQSGVPLTAPADADHGLKVRRSYLDENGQPLNPTTLRSGDLVQVQITLEAPLGLQHLVIEDLLPAGLEIENPRLNTTAAAQAPARIHAPRLQRSGSTAEEPTLQNIRLDIRDDRLILIGDMPDAAIVKHVYLARAVTPGTFVLPPVRAECMYDLALNSLSGGGGTLIVQPLEARSIAKK